jgi:cellulose synthase/poly-beta-1,6-N-acetylglucosamine synthase-like glycosyltransferase
VRGAPSRFAELLAIARELRAATAEQSAVLADLRAQIEELKRLPQWGADRDRVLELLRLVYWDEPAARRWLYDLRASEDYRRAFELTDPLVSVVIPTYDNYRLLAERSLPSVLEQSYRNWEVIVVGDAAPPEAEDVVRSIGDERVSYYNLNRRGPYPEDPKAMWYIAGAPPLNEAIYRAGGTWLAPLGDDDAFRPHHIEALLELALRERVELAYGKELIHFPDASTATLGVFPPRYTHFNLQAALFLRDLRFFGFQLADSLFQVPGDWSFFERMLRVGLRTAMLDEIVTDYYPAHKFTPREDIRHPMDPVAEKLSGA